MIVFRCDTSAVIGYGHLRRCLVLAGHYLEMGCDVRFLIHRPPEPVKELLAGHGATWTDIDTPAGWPGWLDKHADRIRLLVIDHYGIGIDEEKKIAGRLPVMVIDDLCRAHDCDLLVDQTFGRTPACYENRIAKKDTLVLTGERYTLIDPVYHGIRSSRNLRHILLSFGATDHRSAALAVLDMLDSCFKGRDLVFHVPVSSLSPCLDGLEKMKTRARADVRIYTDLPDLSGLYRTCGAAIGAPGTSLLERIHCGLLNVTVSVADNQASVARAVSEAGAAVHLGDLDHLDASVLAKELDKLLTDPVHRDGLKTRMQGLVDGKGACRVIRRTLPLISPVCLRPARKEDEDRLFIWQSRSGARRFFKNPDPPERQEHHRWFQRVTADPAVRLMIIEWLRTPVGFIRLDRAGREQTVSVLVDRPFREKGLARTALKRLLQEKGQTYRAVIHPENHPSLCLFTSAGFRADAAPRADGSQNEQEAVKWRILQY